jgi:hypothetical protein
VYEVESFEEIDEVEELVVWQVYRENKLSVLQKILGNLLVDVTLHPYDKILGNV